MKPYKKSRCLILGIVYFVLFFCLNTSLNAQDYRTPILKKLAQEMVDSLNFKGVIMVNDHEKNLLTFTEGMASHEFNVLHHRNTKFKIASITKMMTSYSVFILKSQNKLTLDQPISSFIPELKKEISSKITIEHLLKHRSGLLRDFDMLSDNINANPISTEESIALLNNTELAFEPGTSYAYSNVGYTLLGLIISRIMEQPYGEAMQTLLFDPLQMQSTGHEAFDDIIENKATGYDRLHNDIVKSKSGYPSHVLGAGSLYSTAPDLLKFSEEIQNGNLLSNEDKELYIKDTGNFQTESGWVTWRYGDKSKRKQVIMHGGSTPGFRSVIAIFLADNITVVALTNQTPMNISLYYNKLGNAALSGDKEDVLEPQLDKLMPFILEGKLDLAQKLYEQNLTNPRDKEKTKPEKIKPSEINSSGYSFLEHFRVKEAIKIFRFAVQLFPSNANAFDSLGEALLKNGQNEEAVVMYKKSLQLNPENRGAIEILNRISSDKK